MMLKAQPEARQLLQLPVSWMHLRGSLVDGVEGTVVAMAPAVVVGKVVESAEFVVSKIVVGTTAVVVVVIVDASPSLDGVVSSWAVAKSASVANVASRSACILYMSASLQKPGAVSATSLCFALPQKHTLCTSVSL